MSGENQVIIQSPDNSRQTPGMFSHEGKGALGTKKTSKQGASRMQSPQDIFNSFSNPPDLKEGGSSPKKVSVGAQAGEQQLIQHSVLSPK